MGIKTTKVDSLGEYYDAIAHIGRDIAEKRNLSDIVPVLWFRAESNVKYPLLPSLYRLNFYSHGTKLDSDEQYTNIHYAEDIRTQHYQAKNYHYLSKEPSSRLEYLEVMQHHGVRARVLDWSESSTHSLLFAMEPFYCEKAIGFNNRDERNPCVWVLDPYVLNKKLFEKLLNKDCLLKNLIKELGMNSADVKKVIERTKNLFCERNLEEYYCGKDTKHIDHILNLAELNNEVFRDRGRLAKLFKYKEAFNPLFYFLTRIYSDGFLLDDYELPPLAVVQPYHSERIKAQKGVFTVFPFYKEIENQPNDLLLEDGFNPVAMSYNAIASECLHKIVFLRPQSIAREILVNGMNESWLYPEMPVASNEIEKHMVY